MPDQRPTCIVLHTGKGEDAGYFASVSARARLRDEWNNATAIYLVLQCRISLPNDLDGLIDLSKSIQEADRTLFFPSVGHPCFRLNVILFFYNVCVYFACVFCRNTHSLPLCIIVRKHLLCRLFVSCPSRSWDVTAKATNTGIYRRANFGVHARDGHACGAVLR